ncbi:MAG: hypothetical protein Q4Q07_08825 [Tissierellia bacterium]|nr:hypothetical protein [Tissierellia bacterium]
MVEKIKDFSRQKIMNIIKMINKNKNYSIYLIFFISLLIIIKVSIIIYLIFSKKKNNHYTKKFYNEIEHIKKKINIYKYPNNVDHNYNKYKLIKDILLEKEIKYITIKENKNIPLYIKEKINEINNNFLSQDIRNEIQLIEDKIKKNEDYVSHIKNLHYEYAYQKYIYNSIKLIFKLWNNKIQKKNIHLKKINIVNLILKNTAEIKTYIQNIKKNKQKYNIYLKRIHDLDYLYCKTIEHSIENPSSFKNHLELDNEFHSKINHYKTNDYIIINKNLHVEYSNRLDELLNLNKKFKDLINELYIKNLELFLCVFN